MIKNAHDPGYDKIAKELQKPIDEEQEMMEKPLLALLKTLASNNILFYLKLFWH